MTIKPRASRSVNPKDNKVKTGIDSVGGEMKLLIFLVS